MTRQHSRLHKEQDRRLQASNLQLNAPPSNTPFPCTPSLSRSLAMRWGERKRSKRRAAKAAEGSAVAAQFAVAALPAELMHSERSSRLSKSVVGSAHSLIRAAAPICVSANVCACVRVGIPIRSFRCWRG